MYQTVNTGFKKYCQYRTIKQVSEIKMHNFSLVPRRNSIRLSKITRHKNSHVSEQVSNWVQYWWKRKAFYQLGNANLQHRKSSVQLRVVHIAQKDKKTHTTSRSKNENPGLFHVKKFKTIKTKVDLERRGGIAVRIEGRREIEIDGAEFGPK